MIFRRNRELARKSCPIDISNKLRIIVRSYITHIIDLAFPKNAEPMSLATWNNAYSDELITATELNRQPGRVLDKALEHPVTITRNDQSFALLRREEVTFLVKAARQSRTVFEVLNVAFRLLLGQKIGSEHPYGWLRVFDSDELQDLIAEVSEAYRLADSSNLIWDQLDDIIHEWHESAIALVSSEIAAAFSDRFDEVPLTQPDAVSSAEP